MNMELSRGETTAGLPKVSQSKPKSKLLYRYDLPGLKDSFQVFIDQSDPNVSWRVLYREFAKKHNQGKERGLIPHTTIGQNGVFGEYRIKPMNVQQLANMFGGVVFNMLAQKSISNTDSEVHKR